ncbi:CHASE2 domain-containing protein [Scytonema sp. UIC 10036]|uniref:CHASE2 domain-containing protein n=1 Tax=Scytonema sp. UIC 10036 TaxID=2304196 RepID=UPI0012DAEAEF|nr:CHASE2 domain-containing protein [Scytonema sp. UIC 10036]MUH00838.1 CHASE2 domain-containing protein [Scytonema sp. UIC 10036]
MLLNYRTFAGKLDGIAEHTPVENFIGSNPPPELANLVKNRIVIIGVTDEEFVDNNLVSTLYNQKISPVWVHAQMISQILSAVEDSRPQTNLSSV